MPVDQFCYVIFSEQRKVEAQTYCTKILLDGELRSVPILSVHFWILTWISRTRGDQTRREREVDPLSDEVLPISPYETVWWRACLSKVRTTFLAISDRKLLRKEQRTERAMSIATGHREWVATSRDPLHQNSPSTSSRKEIAGVSLFSHTYNITDARPACCSAGFARLSVRSDTKSQSSSLQVGDKSGYLGSELAWLIC